MSVLRDGGIRDSDWEEIWPLGKKTKIKWLSDCEAHDYPAAQSYLGLIYDVKTASCFVKKLRHEPVVKFKAKDIFRASGLSMLGVSNSHVRADQKK